MKRVRTATAVAAAALALLAAATAGGIVGQRYPRKPLPGESFTPSLLPAIRRASGMFRGDLPTRIDAIVLTRFERSAASIAEGAPDEPVPAVRAAFQVHYPSGWIMVDGGLGPEFDPRGETPTAEAYALLQASLRGAALIVFTHEHLDHVAGVVRSPYRDELEERVLFTGAQLRALTLEGPESLIRLEPEEAALFLSIDYDPLMPVAPGVVLVKAPGHTPGSQLVYVRLASGEEVIFAGDVANIWSAVVEGRQKPKRPDLNEDRAAIAKQMEWLREVSREGVHVLLAHDYAGLSRLVDRGIIGVMKDAGRPIVSEKGAGEPE